MHLGMDPKRPIKILKPHFKMLIFLKILLAVFISLFSLITNMYVHEKSEQCTPLNNIALKCSFESLALQSIAIKK